MPVTAVTARSCSLTALARLWVVTQVFNLAGGWLLPWLIAKGFPQHAGTGRAVGSHYAQPGVTLRSFYLAVLAGAVITLMTRMQHATDGTKWRYAQIPRPVASRPFRHIGRHSA